MKTARWRALGRTDALACAETIESNGKREGSDDAEPSQEGPGRVDLPETALSLTSSR